MPKMQLTSCGDRGLGAGSSSAGMAASNSRGPVLRIRSAQTATTTRYGAGQRAPSRTHAQRRPGRSGPDSNEFDNPYVGNPYPEYELAAKYDIHGNPIDEEAAAAADVARARQLSAARRSRADAAAAAAEAERARRMRLQEYQASTGLGAIAGFQDVDEAGGDVSAELRDADLDLLAARVAAEGGDLEADWAAVEAGRSTTAVAKAGRALGGRAAPPPPDQLLAPPSNPKFDRMRTEAKQMRRKRRLFSSDDEQGDGSMYDSGYGSSSDDDGLVGYSYTPAADVVRSAGRAAVPPPARMVVPPRTNPFLLLPKQPGDAVGAEDMDALLDRLYTDEEDVGESRRGKGRDRDRQGRAASSPKSRGPGMRVGDDDEEEEEDIDALLESSGMLARPTRPGGMGSAAAAARQAEVEEYDTTYDDKEEVNNQYSDRMLKALRGALAPSDGAGQLLQAPQRGGNQQQQKQKQKQGLKTPQPAGLADSGEDYDALMELLEDLGSEMEAELRQEQKEDDLDDLDGMRSGAGAGVVGRKQPVTTTGLLRDSGAEAGPAKPQLLGRPGQGQGRPAGAVGSASARVQSAARSTMSASMFGDDDARFLDELLEGLDVGSDDSKKVVKSKSRSLPDLDDDLDAWEALQKFPPSPALGGTSSQAAVPSLQAKPVQRGRDVPAAQAASSSSGSATTAAGGTKGSGSRDPAGGRGSGGAWERQARQDLDSLLDGDWEDGGGPLYDRGSAAYDSLMDDADTDLGAYFAGARSAAAAAPQKPQLLAKPGVKPVGGSGTSSSSSGSGSVTKGGNKGGKAGLSSLGVADLDDMMAGLLEDDDDLDDIRMPSRYPAQAAKPPSTPAAAMQEPPRRNFGTKAGTPPSAAVSDGPVAAPAPQTASAAGPQPKASTAASSVPDPVAAAMDAVAAAALAARLTDAAAMLRNPAAAAKLSRLEGKEQLAAAPQRQQAAGGRKGQKPGQGQGRRRGEREDVPAVKDASVAAADGTVLEPAEALTGMGGKSGAASVVAAAEGEAAADGLSTAGAKDVDAFVDVAVAAAKRAAAAAALQDPSAAAKLSGQQISDSRASQLAAPPQRERKAEQQQQPQVRPRREFKAVTGRGEAKAGGAAGGKQVRGHNGGRGAGPRKPNSEAPGTVPGRQGQQQPQQQAPVRPWRPGRLPPPNATQAAPAADAREPAASQPPAPQPEPQSTTAFASPPARATVLALCVGALAPVQPHGSSRHAGAVGTAATTGAGACQALPGRWRRLAVTAGPRRVVLLRTATAAGRARCRVAPAASATAAAGMPPVRLRTHRTPSPRGQTLSPTVLVSDPSVDSESSSVRARATRDEVFPPAAAYPAAGRWRDAQPCSPAGEGREGRGAAGGPPGGSRGRPVMGYSTRSGAYRQEETDGDGGHSPAMMADAGEDADQGGAHEAPGSPASVFSERQGWQGSPRLPGGGGWQQQEEGAVAVGGRSSSNSSGDGSGATDFPREFAQLNFAVANGTLHRGIVEGYDPASNTATVRFAVLEALGVRQPVTMPGSQLQLWRNWEALSNGQSGGGGAQRGEASAPGAQGPGPRAEGWRVDAASSEVDAAGGQAGSQAGRQRPFSRVMWAAVVDFRLRRVTGSQQEGSEVVPTGGERGQERRGGHRAEQLAAEGWALDVLMEEAVRPNHRYTVEFIKEPHLITKRQEVLLSLAKERVVASGTVVGWTRRGVYVQVDLALAPAGSPPGELHASLAFLSRDLMAPPLAAAWPGIYEASTAALKAQQVGADISGSSSGGTGASSSSQEGGRAGHGGEEGQAQDQWPLMKLGDLLQAMLTKSGPKGCVKGDSGLVMGVLSQQATLLDDVKAWQRGRELGRREGPLLEEGRDS